MSNDVDIVAPRSRNSRNGLILWTLAALAFAGYVYLHVRSQANSGPGHPSVGTPVTELVLEPLTGTAAAVTSRELEGRVVLLNFWGTWCGPCRHEFPHLVQLERRFAGQDDFRLVSVSVPFGQEDLHSLAEHTEEYLSRQGAEFATYADLGGAAYGRVAEATGLSSAGIPLTIVLDRQARIRGVWQGYQPGDEVSMARLLTELL